MGGIDNLSAFAVLRFITNSNLVGNSTGISPGFSPPKDNILSCNLSNEERTAQCLPTRAERSARCLRGAVDFSIAPHSQNDSTDNKSVNCQDKQSFARVKHCIACLFAQRTANLRRPSVRHQINLAAKPIRTTAPALSRAICSQRFLAISICITSLNLFCYTLVTDRY
jgi:hypothetical protein